MALISLHALIDNLANIFYKYLIDGINSYPFKTIILILVGFIGMRLISILVHSLAFYVTDKFMFLAGRDLRVDVFTHLHNLDFSFHSTKRSGSLISAIKRGDGVYFGINHHFTREVLRIIVDFIFIVIAFSILSPDLVLIVIVSVTLSLFLTYKLVAKNIDKRTVFNKEEDNVSHLIVDNLINYDTVKYFAKEEWERNRLLSTYKSWMNALWDYANTFRLIDISIGLTTLVGSAATILLALSKTFNNELSVGDLVLIIALVTKFFPQLGRLIYQLREIAKNYIDVEKYVALLDHDIEVKEIENPISLKDIKGEIEFKNLDFSYKDREKVLSNINLKIQPGESVAFVGESGAGKTTLTKLLLRFYDPTNGQIKLDGVDIKSLAKSNLRSNIGIVPQDPILFNDTIDYNIAYGRDNVTEEDLYEAVEIANLNEFVDTLPLKFEALVGERGIKLSGGQKQRLAIARMFLANPPVLIFDEATSQLDSKSEKLIQEAFWRIAKDKTTIIIAHRLSTVMKSDRIVVIDNGQISEEGTHKDLIEHKGVYSNLWNLQQGELLRD